MADKRSKYNIVQSLLDYILISESISYLVNNVTINIGLSSDHSLIGIELELNAAAERGRDLWKFNNDLLTDKNYISLIKTTLKNYKRRYSNGNLNKLWEYAKCQISMVCSSKRSKEMRQKENLTKRVH